MHSMNFYNLLLLTHGLSDRIGIALGAILFTTIIGFIVGPIMGNANPPVWAFLDKLFGFGRKSYKVTCMPARHRCNHPCAMNTPVDKRLT
jgi:hypothetical protein